MSSRQRKTSLVLIEGSGTFCTFINLETWFTVLTLVGHGVVFTVWLEAHALGHFFFPPALPSWHGLRALLPKSTGLCGVLHPGSAHLRAAEMLVLERMRNPEAGP